MKPGTRAKAFLVASAIILLGYFAWDNEAKIAPEVGLVGNRIAHLLEPPKICLETVKKATYVEGRPAISVQNKAVPCGPEGNAYNR